MNRPTSQSRKSSATNNPSASPTAMRTRIYQPDEDAPVIINWIKSKQELLHVAPSNVGPLTVEQVRKWVRPGGQAYVLTRKNENTPIAYGEVMPLHEKSTHRWLGHVIVAPAYRSQGLGTEWTRRLIQRAFDEPDVTNVSLVVFPDNPPAIAAYQRAGMTITGQETHRFGQPTRTHKLIRLEITRE